MRWSLDVHKYISEITRKALQIIVAHGITSQSSDEDIDVVEHELASANIYKNYDGAKGRVRRALFTYFKAYGCLNDSEQLTEVGKAFSDNELSIQEFCFYFIVNYKFSDNEVSYYPVEFILKFLKAVGSGSFEDAYLTPYDFSRLVGCDSIDEINDEFVSTSLNARENAPIDVEERKIGYDVWSKMLINAGILEKNPDKTLRAKNANLVEWMLSAYEKNNDSVKGKMVTGIICDIPVFSYGQCSGWEEYKGEVAALQAFLFEGIDISIIEKYIKKTLDISFETLLFKVGLNHVDCGFYEDFIGLEKLVAYRLQNHEADSCKVIGGILLKSDIVPLTIRDEEFITGGSNVLLYGVPGSGKSHTVKSEYCNNPSKMERVVFHPDYTYSDFIGQILPCAKGDRISYEFNPGPFTKLLSKAQHDPANAYFLIIEEINRGNAPAIFGEVFQLLDRTCNEETKGTSEYGISNSDIARIVYDGDESQLVKLPSNLHIIATMNTSDQNVFTLDTAFQRRWNMRMIENDVANVEHALVKVLDTDVTWRVFNETINGKVLENNMGLSSSEDKRLGAYFVGVSDLLFNSVEDDVNASPAEKARARAENSRFPEKILKYLWDDAFKFSRESIFEPQYRSLEELVKAFKEKRGQARFSVFKQGLFENSEQEQ